MGTEDKATIGKLTAQIGELADHVRDCQDTFEICQAKTEEAKRAENSALNTLNQAQANFDKAVDALKQQSPHNADWKSNERMSTYVFTDDEGRKAVLSDRCR